MLQPPAGQAAATHKNLDAAPFEQLGQAVCRVEFLRQGYQQSSGKPSQPWQRGLETQFSGCFQDAYRATDKPGHGQEKQQVENQPQPALSHAFLVARQQVVKSPPERGNRL